jgi:hypothetical protein
MSISPDGKLLAVAEKIGGVRLWNLDERSWLIRAESIVNRDFTPEERTQYRIEALED